MPTETESQHEREENRDREEKKRMKRDKEKIWEEVDLSVAVKATSLLIRTSGVYRYKNITRYLFIITDFLTNSCHIDQV